MVGSDGLGPTLDVSEWDANSEAVSIAIRADGDNRAAPGGRALPSGWLLTHFAYGTTETLTAQRNRNTDSSAWSPVGEGLGEGLGDGAHGDAGGFGLGCVEDAVGARGFGSQAHEFGFVGEEIE